MALSVLTAKQVGLPRKQGWIIITYISIFEGNSEELEPLIKRIKRKK